MQSMCMVDFVMRYLVEGTPKLGSDGGGASTWDGNVADSL